MNSFTAMAASNMSMMKSSLPIRETETYKTMTTSDFTRIMYKRSPEVSAKVTDRLDTLASRGQIVIRNNQTNKTGVDKTFNFVPRQLTDANKKLRKQALQLGLTILYSISISLLILNYILDCIKKYINSL